MTPGLKAIGAGIGAAAIGALVAVLAMGGLERSTTAPDPAATGAIVRSYILAHPDIIPEALEKLKQTQTASLIAANRAAIETPFPGAVGGNPKGDVTLVEYFDYACVYCRSSLADVDRLVAGDAGVRVVYKELPILSDYSGAAAKLSLAAARAGRFADYHHALYGTGALDPGRIAAAAAGVGVAPAAGEAPDIAREIEANLATAHALRLSGTPTFIVGDQMLSGAVGLDALKDAVAEARRARKT
jgi:protein-disulfide isomerase